MGFNFSNKQLNRERNSRLLPTSLVRGGIVEFKIIPIEGDLPDTELWISETVGYIKKNNTHSITVYCEKQNITDLNEVITLDGNIDAYFIGECAVCLNTESEVVLVELPEGETYVDDTKYLQLGRGFFWDGFYGLEYDKNAVLGIDTPTAIRILSEAMGRLSNVKIRPSKTNPMRIEAYVENRERKSNYLYGSNFKKAFRISGKIGTVHIPELELGEIDNYRGIKKGSGSPKRGQHAKSHDAISAKTYADANSHDRNKNVPNDKWIACAIDMYDVQEGYRINGVPADSSFIIYHDPQLYNSKKEALNSLDLIDTETDRTRLGWVILKGGCTDLSDKTQAEVISTDRFGTQMYNKPYISDKERAKDMGKFIDYVKKSDVLNDILIEKDNEVITVNSGEDYGKVNRGSTEPLISNNNLIMGFEDRNTKISALKITFKSAQKPTEIRAMLGGNFARVNLDKWQANTTQDYWIKFSSPSPIHTLNFTIKDIELYKIRAYKYKITPETRPAKKSLDRKIFVGGVEYELLPNERISNDNYDPKAEIEALKVLLASNDTDFDTLQEVVDKTKLLLQLDTKQLNDILENKGNIEALQGAIQYINNTTADLRDLISSNKTDIQTREPKLPRGTFEDLLDGKNEYKLFTGGDIFSRIKALAKDITGEALIGKVNRTKVIGTNKNTRANLLIPDWTEYLTITFGDRRANFRHRRTTIVYPISEIKSLGTSGKKMLSKLDGATYDFGGAYNNGTLSIQDNVSGQPNKYGAVVLAVASGSYN